MNWYHVWCDLKPGVKDTDFSDSAAAHLNQLQKDGVIEGWRLTRRKLGFGPRSIGEFHISIGLIDLRQLESAFRQVASRAEPIESLHHGLNSLAANLTFALYRDFPDPERKRGEEKF